MAFETGLCFSGVPEPSSCEADGLPCNSRLEESFDERTASPVMGLPSEED